MKRVEALELLKKYNKEPSVNKEMDSIEVH